MKTSKKETCKKSIYRVKSRSRFLFSVLIFFFMVICTFNFAINSSMAHTIQNSELVSVEIQAGDCLWNIAQKYAPSGMDTRKAVYEICKLNNIEAHTIVAGQIIQIPDYN